MTVIKDEGFACAEDNYNLCSNCVRTTAADFVGNVLTNLRDEILKAFGLGKLPDLFEDFMQYKVDISKTFEGYEEYKSGMLDNLFDY
jgi:hypothetical protein